MKFSMHHTREDKIKSMAQDKSRDPLFMSIYHPDDDWEWWYGDNLSSHASVLTIIMIGQSESKKADSLRKSPGKVHEFLKKELLSDDIEVRWDAILALEMMPDEQATDLLMQALKDEQFMSIRWRAATALGNRGDPRAVQALVFALDDPEFYVREKAAEALGRIGEMSAVESLIRAFKDKDKDVRWRIIRALIEIGAPAEDQLKEAKKSTDILVREGAEEVLKEIGERRKRRERVRG